MRCNVLSEALYHCIMTIIIDNCCMLVSYTNCNDLICVTIQQIQQYIIMMVALRQYRQTKQQHGHSTGAALCRQHCTSH